MKLFTLQNNSRLARMLLIGVLILGFACWQQWSAPSAAAAGYSIRSQGDCAAGYPRGDSWLNWWGYFFASWGETDGTLNMYDVFGNVSTTAFGHSGDSGVDGHAVVRNSSPWQPATYRETGAHWSSFFGGTQYSYGNFFTC